MALTMVVLFAVMLLLLNKSEITASGLSGKFQTKWHLQKGCIKGTGGRLRSALENKTRELGHPTVLHPAIVGYEGASVDIETGP